jgi:hypothetical protein
MRRLLWIALAAGVAAAAKAQVGRPGVAVGPMPNYFSGTNCRAYGGAQIGEPLVDAELYLHNELVHEYHHSGYPEETYPMSMGLAVMFDCSHWPNGWPVEVKYRVRGLYTFEWQYAVDARQIWNKALFAATWFIWRAHSKADL